MPRTVHIIGAGLAGLSAGVRLATPANRVIVHEATAFAGGRCRSYHDASVGMTIDNGNHLLLSGNRAALDFLRRIGSADCLIGPTSAEFPFLDLKSRARWALRGLWCLAVVWVECLSVNCLSPTLKKLLILSMLKDFLPIRIEQ